MLYPDYLDALPAGVEARMQELEQTVIREISTALARSGTVSGAQAQQMLAAGRVFDVAGLERELAKQTGKTVEEIGRLFDEALGASLDAEVQLYRKAGMYHNGVLDPVLQMLSDAKAALMGDVANLTATAGFVAQVGGVQQAYTLTQFYQSTLTTAQMQVYTGVVDYNTAIKRAVDTMARSGLRTIDYASGTTRRIDTATRSAVLTGVAQASGRMTSTLADELGADVMEITAHAGARPSHAVWQGQLVSRSGRAGYLSLFDIGYGEPAGFLGVNCRHSWYPYLEGYSTRAYTDAQLRNIDPPPIEWEGKTYTAYEATQMQRRYERSIRNWRDRVVGYDAAGLDDQMDTAAVRLKRLTDGYEDFSRRAKLPTQEERMYVFGYTSEIDKKIVRIQREMMEKYSGYRYNKDGTIVVTDDWKERGHCSIPRMYRPYAVVETISGRAKQIDRTYYDADALMAKQIHSGDHGRPDLHPYGEHGEHAHWYDWKKEKEECRRTGELTLLERRESSDIL